MLLDCIMQIYFKYILLFCKIVKFNAFSITLLVNKPNYVESTFVVVSLLIWQIKCIAPSH